MEEVARVIDLSLKDDKLLSKQILDSCTDNGFIQFKNHGISQKIIDELFKEWTLFMESPLENKMKFVKKEGAINNRGYIQFAREGANINRSGDLKEVYSMNMVKGCPLPTEKLEDLSMHFDNLCFDLSKRILELIAKSMNIQEDTFSKMHSPLPMQFPERLTAVRCCYYSALRGKCEWTEDAIRCGEHTDFGSITLLFQDETGGLQLKNTDGVYVDVKPEEGCICVNIGDFLQMWTGDKLKSTEHRVVLPKNHLDKSRMSFAYFMHPDAKENIIPLPGYGDQRKEVNSRDYLFMKLNQIT